MITRDWKDSSPSLKRFLDGRKWRRYDPEQVRIRLSSFRSTTDLGVPMSQQNPRVIGFLVSLFKSERLSGMSKKVSFSSSSFDGQSVREE